MERKSYAFKAALEQNVIKGGPAVIGNMDEGQDVIFPGAFRDVLPGFLKSGFIAFGHAWDELPIGYPTVAKEQGRILYSEAQFHSTQAAQDARTVAQERSDAGLTVGLSIGFQCEPDDCKFFDSGEVLWMYAKEKGYDLSLFDKPSIMGCEGWCRGLTGFSELYEWSIVPVPMNRDAQATGIKGVWTPDEAKSRAWALEADPKADQTHDPQNPTVRELEKLLRDAGLSHTVSRRFISMAKTLPRDAASEDAGTTQTEPDEAQTEASETQTAIEAEADETAPTTTVEGTTEEPVETAATDIPPEPEAPKFELPTGAAAVVFVQQQRTVGKLHQQFLELEARRGRWLQQ